MADVLQSSPSHFPSPSSSSSGPCASNDGTNPHDLINRDQEITNEENTEETKEREREGNQLSLLEILVSAFRKSVIGCSISGGEELCSMEIGVPTNVRHVAHVTFDRFNGFLGLPVEFEPEVPRRPPSASATVFGVSTESMQLSLDSRRNSIPTILLMMQRHLYARGGLQAEGIFRINGENGQEEYIREQLNKGMIPNDIDVHCLAGLIKAWFRELPTGVLDPLSPEQVMQSQTEEECVQLVRLLPPTEAALLDWAINLMADIAQMQHLNKMNARNIAMVFAPNMTQMSDPLTALMYAVQVMNFLKTLIVKTLRERQDSTVEAIPNSGPEPSDQNGDENTSHVLNLNESNREEPNDDNKEQETFVTSIKGDSATENKSLNLLSSIENLVASGNRSMARDCPCEIVKQVNNEVQETGKDKTDRQSGSKMKKVSKKGNEESKGSSLVGRVNFRLELFEAWR